MRPVVGGKFLKVGERKLFVRGVTYGPFRPEANGCEYHTPERVAQDFARMRENGINCVRVYTVPPKWLLDLALQHGLRVMVGLPWEQHITFLDEKGRADAVEQRVRSGVRACAGHPAVLCYSIGNEVPASIVRWHGARRVESFLERLFRAAKDEDPEGLVTYVNYPTTEYLQLPFLDLACFNVYLESRDRLSAYLARLQNLAGDRPLLMAEVGLDSRRNGEEAQAHALEWQVRTAFAAGCAGAFAFAWTDEWHRGGFDIEDWDFGLTDRDRRPKPALAAVARAFAESPFPPKVPWPRISVVVCTRNGANTVGECLRGLQEVQYPSFEVLVVDDGSTDESAAIASGYDVHLIRTENRGLSSARNTGMRAATGEIVAYIDDDAHPDPHWLTYLADTFRNTTHAGVGGPNIPPPGDGPVAECVANAPGGPIHVLLSDTEAEHIPGCNMAFRKSCLQAIGGFDPQFRVAGDDVDVCWRMQQRGWTLGFSPAAMVWHHRRGSVRAYWRQQKGYGKAEALLERKWPEKYNAAGHVGWSGRLYGRGVEQQLGSRRGRIYQGTWGSALFQSIYQPAPSLLRALPRMPEWYLMIALLAVLSLLSADWTPLVVAPALILLAVAAPVVSAAGSAARASFTWHPRSRPSRLWLHGLTALLYLIQPIARLVGRLSSGLTPWRRYGVPRFSLLAPRTFTVWSESWRASDQWLLWLESVLRAQGAVVLRGGDYDEWDFEVQSGTLGAVRIRMAVEEHGGGKQLVRFRTWSRWSLSRVSLILLFAAMTGGAAYDGAWIAAGFLGGTTLFLALRKLHERVTATTTVLCALRILQAETQAAVDPAKTSADRPRLRIPRVWGYGLAPEGSIRLSVGAGGSETRPRDGALVGRSAIEVAETGSRLIADGMTR